MNLKANAHGAPETARPPPPSRFPFAPINAPPAAIRMFPWLVPCDFQTAIQLEANTASWLRVMAVYSTTRFIFRRRDLCLMIVREFSTAQTLRLLIRSFVPTSSYSILNEHSPSPFKPSFRLVYRLHMIHLSRFKVPCNVEPLQNRKNRRNNSRNPARASTSPKTSRNSRYSPGKRLTRFSVEV